MLSNGTVSPRFSGDRWTGRRAGTDPFAARFVAEVACGLRFPLRCMRVDRGMLYLRENRLVRENYMSGNVTEVLAGFAASLQYNDLPAAARDHCKNLLLDTLACAVA